MSRRAFLVRGTVTAATVGAVASVPGLSGLLTVGETEAPAVESETTATAAAEADVGSLAQPLVAHVKDLQTGEISLFQGQQEVVVRNPALARQLFSALHR
jgi:hypothetical protein